MSILRFDYSPEFLRWALTPPHYVPEWHFGVRVKANGKVLGHSAVAWYRYMLLS